MDQIIPGLIVSFTVALVTGLAAFAYKHPRAYNRFGGALLWALGIVFCGAAVWNLSNQTVLDAIFAQDRKVDGLQLWERAQIAGIVMGLRVPGWLMLIVLAVIAYLAGLTQLWRLVALDKPKPPKAVASPPAPALAGGTDAAENSR
jgi:hypothetical protein